MNCTATSESRHHHRPSSSDSPDGKTSATRDTAFRLQTPHIFSSPLHADTQINLELSNSTIFVALIFSRCNSSSTPTSASSVLVIYISNLVEHHRIQWNIAKKGRATLLIQANASSNFLSAFTL
jgi:hypothetical protein